jgi:hypothetical protein
MTEPISAGVGPSKIEQWFAGLDESEQIEPDTEPDAPGLAISLSIENIYFVFTSDCFSKYSSTNCADSTVGSMCFRSNLPDFLPGGRKTSTWGFGKRITDDINPSFSENILEILRQPANRISDVQKLAVRSSLPLTNVSIFCAPCARAIHTAVRTCNQQSTELISYMVRVDDRISASCSSGSSKIGRLKSLLAKINEFEAGMLADRKDLFTSWILFLDRVWIEQRIDHLENEPHIEGIITNGMLIAEFFKTDSFETIIFLGETTQTGWIIESKPFAEKRGMAKDNSIHKLYRSSTFWKREYLGTFTPRDYRIPVTPSVSLSQRSVKQNTAQSGATNTRPDQETLEPPLAQAPSVKLQKIWNPETESASPSLYNSSVKELLTLSAYGTDPGYAASTYQPGPKVNKYAYTKDDIQSSTSSS